MSPFEHGNGIAPFVNLVHIKDITWYLRLGAHCVTPVGSALRPVGLYQQVERRLELTASSRYARGYAMLQLMRVPIA